MKLKSTGKLIRSLALAGILSAGLCISGMPASAAVIYGPGVVPHTQEQTQGSQSTAQAQTQTSAQSPAQAQTQTQSTQTGESSQAGPGPASTVTQGTSENPAVIMPAGLSGQTESGTTQSEPESIIDQSAAAAPNTLVPTGEENIYMINGRRIDITKPVVALTYDDGPQSNAGNRIMDVMAQYGQKCTFFMVGSRVAARATEVKRMVAEGHEVANHTYDHVYLNKTNAQGVINQVTACNDIIEQVSGVRPTLMRLPGGCKNETVLANINMPIILWNLDTLDWKTRDASKTTATVLNNVKSGDIVLMHELYDATAAATEAIVPALTERGFQCVTVSEMAAIRGITLNNRIYYSF